MHRTYKFLLAAFALMALLASTVLVASADATPTEYVLNCNQLSASGTSDSPYVTLYVYDYETEAEYFAVLPVTGGAWSGSFTFPEFPAGTVLNVEIWGSLVDYTDPDDPDYWDEGDYFDEDLPCIPTGCSNPLPADSVVYDVPFGAPAYFNADLQSAANFSLPAGTWKISEFSGDFAKVWIACEGDPVWIPRSAVGGAIG